MTQYTAPLNDLAFVMFSTLQCEQHWQTLGLNDLDQPMALAALEAAGKICEDVIAPLNREADEQGCHWSPEGVTTPHGFKNAYNTFYEGGWGALSGNPEHGGMGLPKSLVSATEEMLQGACMAFGLAPMLTAGACLALDAHGSEALKALFLPKLYSGAWSGAMDLTEPHAGTDLGLIRTQAIPCEHNLFSEGAYRITGTKIFITWGEHDMTENIVHLVLAKLPDAPKGTKGISLFLVPKWIPNAQGACVQQNAVHCGSLEKKMGIKASATCVMNFDGALGWLVGQPHQGLACMFTMMNYERLVVGIQALGVAELAYQKARHYAHERLQSRSPFGPQNLTQNADPILVHPDVRRLLLTAKVLNEAGRAFYIYVAQWLDTAKFSSDSQVQLNAQNRVALLTPVTKAFLTDMAFDAAVNAQQVLGGHGYIREWGLEQCVRDIRITQIYEGTNGIQAMDFMVRRIIANQGRDLMDYLNEMEHFINEQTEALQRLSLKSPLCEAIEKLRTTGQHIITLATQDPGAAGTGAVAMLHFTGYVCYAFLWAKMAVAAEQQTGEFYRAKLKSAQFYYAFILPRIHTLAITLQMSSQSVMAFEDGEF